MVYTSVVSVPAHGRTPSGGASVSAADGPTSLDRRRGPWLPLTPIRYNLRDDEGRRISVPDRCPVLVIEDDTDIRESVRLLLDMEEFPVLEATDGAAGLDVLLRSATPLIVLVDYMMPGMNGLQMLREVAKSQSLAQRNIYVLVTANYDRLPPGDADMLAALRVGKVNKPFNIDALLAVVERACRSLTGGATAMLTATPAVLGAQNSE
jgi:CheY-like chemotaxis protein